MRRIAILGASSFALFIVSLTPSVASAATYPQCPAVFHDTGCQFLVTVTDSGLTVAEDPSQGPYEGSDDALIGIQNNSSHAITSIPLSAEGNLFGFDADGICNPGSEILPAECVILPKNSTGEVTGGKNPANSSNPGGESKCGAQDGDCGFLPPAGEPAGNKPFATNSLEIAGLAENGTEVSGYEGPTSWFSNISAEDNSGIINFSPALAPGTSTYFAAESPPIGGFGTATTLSTTLTGGGQVGGSITVVQGTPVSDSATIAGTGASIATGAVNYSVFADAGCTQLAASAGSAAVAAGAAGASTALSGLAPGKYYWQASYPGDVNNHAASSPCGSEVLTVLAPTTTSTTQSGGGVTSASITVPVGTPVTDTAQVAGSLAASSTGTVSYVLYKDNKCTVPAAATSASAVLKGAAGPSVAVKPAAGTYYWRASYSGDGANAGSVSTCGSEVLLVAKKTNLGLAHVLGNGKQCVSMRRFIAHPRAPKGVKLVSVEVQINGKRASLGQLIKGATTINLRGLPKGTFKVALIATSSKGQTFEDVRTFHTCVPKKHHHKKK
jgi:hypothetical protein